MKRSLHSLFVSLCLRCHSLYALQMSVLHSHSKKKGRSEASPPLSHRWASVSLSGLQQTLHPPGAPAQPLWDGEKHAELHTCVWSVHTSTWYTGHPATAGHQFTSCRNMLIWKAVLTFYLLICFQAYSTFSAKLLNVI